MYIWSVGHICSTTVHCPSYFDFFSSFLSFKYKIHISILMKIWINESCLITFYLLDLILKSNIKKKVLPINVVINIWSFQCSKQDVNFVWILHNLYKLYNRSSNIWNLICYIRTYELLFFEQWRLWFCDGIIMVHNKIIRLSFYIYKLWMFNL